MEGLEFRNWNSEAGLWMSLHMKGGSFGFRSGYL